MRLLALDLLRYGHLTAVRLAFPQDAALHVVLGANEAGKSTALAAIGDALFGFPHRTRFDFLHDPAQLRIGFEVMASDGSRSAFIRRKGRKDTLLDATENPVSEAALQRLLGGAGRDLFEKAFGLNGATLRDGGRSLIEGGGAAGESLLAGMGLPHLRKALERLDQAADSLHGTKRTTRRLAAAADAWEGAQRALHHATIRPADWTEAQEALQRAEQGLQDIAREEQALKGEELRLRRARGVAPLLARLDRERLDCAEVADARALPAEASETLRRLTAALHKAGEDITRESTAADRLAAELAALPRNPAILAVQDGVDRLAAARGRALDAERDLPEVRALAASQREQVAAGATRLGLDAPPDAVREALPKPSAREAAQRLIRRRTALLTRLESEEKRLRAAERRHERAAAALAQSIAPPPATKLRRAIEAAREEGPLDRDLARAERDLAEAERRRDLALAALEPWSGDAAALAAARLPLPAMAEEAARHLEEATQALDRARTATAEIAAEIATLEEALARLARGHTVPTPQVIAAERARRDTAWRLIRRGLDGGAPPDPADRADLPEGDLPDLFEAFRDAADRLADARADDAQRVNDYAEKTARLGQLRPRQGEAEAARNAAEIALATAEAAWRALWAPAGVQALSSAAMRQWREAREKVLALAEAAEAQRRRCDELVERRKAARATLLALLPESAGAPGLSAALARATEACDAAEAALAAHRTLEDVARQEATLLDEARETRDLAAAELREAGEAWRPAVIALALPADAGVEEVEGALAAWGSIAEAASAWRAAQTRIADMEAVLAAFAGDATALATGLGEATEAAPSALAAGLARRLDAARATETQAAGLLRQLQERRGAADAAQDARRAGEAELVQLHAAAGTDDLPGLEQAVARAARRATLQAEIARLAGELQDRGEGRAEAALRTEVEGFDPDQATLRLVEIETRQAEVGELRTRLGAERQAAQTRLAELEAGHDAFGYAQDAQQALADAQAAAERYARLHTARTLLRAGIERLRQDRQGPMLRAAARHFALLTGGRYARLTTDEEDDGSVLLRAVRGDGTACPLESLSEGARDQLFLALRVAAMEAHAEGAEPLPFIADDLLATFDDERAAAAIALLAQPGRRSQAILFTHHAHIAELAARQKGVHVQALPATAAAPLAEALPAA
ncbi:MAG TPA: AAA family ATPase [Falsiroseomonas sp.]|jgi:uncharacterized protein YhaN|nr:AAA family ATPase [Falsiroseomonas sp.]